MRARCDLVLLFLVTGCDDVLGIPSDAVECANFYVLDESIVADPPDAFPEEPFVLTWEDKTDAQSGSVPNLVERLSLRTPDDFSAVVLLPPRPVPWASSQTSSIAFSEFLAAAPAPGLAPDDYVFVVELSPAADSLAQCPSELYPEGVADLTGQLPLDLPCECDGLYSYGLRVEGGTTVPANPSPADDILLVFDIVYDQVACDGASPVESGDFELEISITGDPGKAGPTSFPVPSMLSGTTTTLEILTDDILSSDRPAGTYNVTVSVDSAGAVPECPDDPTDQTLLFSYTVQ